LDTLPMSGAKSHEFLSYPIRARRKRRGLKTLPWQAM
jgi:hypothetical protein